MKIRIGLLVLRGLSVLPLSWARALAHPLAAVVWRLPWRKHRAVARHLEQALPALNPTERRQLQRDSLSEAAKLLMESGAVWHWPAQRLNAQVRCEGWHHVQSAMAEGRGLLLLGSHLGNWEILSLYMLQRLPMVALYTPPKDAALTRALTASRQRFGGQLVPAGGGATRTMLKALRSGGVVGIIADQQPKRGHGVMAPWFGVPAPTMTLAGRLAQRTGCAVLMARCLRQAGQPGWQVTIRPAQAAIGDADDLTAATALNQTLAIDILEAPAQYLWQYKRYRDA
jgi:KDO2-lipid IV(A) lauroyltransferase